MFPLKQILNHVRRVVPGFRAVSSSPALVGVEVDGEGIATVTLQRAPVNSLNLPMVQDFNKALDYVARNKCKAMILTSASPTVFTAGVDLMELYQPEWQRFETLWSTFQEAWIKLYGSSFITAAAINGHSPASGCVLSISCEYRVMTIGKYTIGMNETVMGITPPQWVIELMANTIPRRETELAFTLSRMFTADEALKVGLIDETATDKVDAVEKCKKFIKRFDTIPSLARAINKQIIREGPLKWMQENSTNDVRDFFAMITTSNIQEALELYIRKLKQKTAK